MANLTEKAPSLSRRMRAALDQDGPPFGRPKPKKRDLQAIKAILARRGKDDSNLALGRVIRVAADADPSDETAKLIAGILNDRKINAAVRLQAAAVLGDLPGVASQRPLVRALAKADVALEFVILNALAKIGDGRAVQAIEELPETSSVRLKRIRDFARIAIAYRSGSEISETTESTVMPTGVASRIQREDSKLIATTVKNIRGSNYGIKFSKDLGYCFFCDQRKHVVLINEKLRKGHLVADIMKGRMIAGIIVMEEEQANEFVTRQLILTRPSRQNVKLSVVHSTGEIAFLGQLRSVGMGLALTLNDHLRERIPTSVEGLITDDEIILSAHVFLESARQKDHGEVAFVLDSDIP